MIMWSLLKKTPAGSRLSPNKRTIPRPRGFTLVEVVVAIGIFAFCIVAVLGLMQVALSASRDSQIDSSIGGLIGNLSASLNSLDANELAAAASTNRYFDEAGRPLSTNAQGSAYFRTTLSAVAPTVIEQTFALPGGTNLHVWAVAIEYPAPQYGRNAGLILGRKNW